MVTKSSKKGKNKSMVVSSCGLKLDGMKFDAVGSTRKEELKHKLTVFPMANIPVVCPLSSCSAVVWKYNLMAHMCGMHIHLYWREINGGATAPHP